MFHIDFLSKCFIYFFDFLDDEPDRIEDQDDEPVTISKCIKITDLPEAIKSLGRDSNKGFQEEFQVNSVANSMYKNMCVINVKLLKGFLF